MSINERTVPDHPSLDRPGETAHRDGALRVEVLGIPGVGKTRLLKLLRRQGSHGVSCVGYKERVGALKYRNKLGGYRLRLIESMLPERLASRWIRKAYNFRLRNLETRALLDFVDRHSAFVEWLFPAINGANVAAREKVLLQHWFERLFTDYQLATGYGDRRHGPPAILMFDEGFAQKAVSLALHLDWPPSLVFDYARLAPIPDLLLVIDASDETVYSRLERRGWPGWVAVNDGDGKRRFLSRCRETVVAAESGFSDRGVPVLHIPNEEAASEVSAHLAGRLAAHLGRC